MPLFSIIIPAYNRRKGIEKTIQSVLNQSFDDFEIIVVDDASKDSTVKTVEKLQEKDSRITLVEHSENKGTHVARKTGVETAKGDYILFVDADDELAPDSLRKLYLHVTFQKNEIVCFDIKVLPSSSKNEKEARNIQNWFNISTIATDSFTLLERAYERVLGDQIPWNIWGKVYKKEIVKEAFYKSSNSRLLFGEDAYELLEILSVKNASVGYEKIQGYIYNYGTGITNSKMLSNKKFEEFFSTALSVITDAEKSLPEEESELTHAKKRAFYGFRRKLLSDVITHWNSRLSKKNQKAFVKQIKNEAIAPVFYKELYRILRDDAYALWTEERKTRSLKTLMDLGKIIETNSDYSYEAAAGTTYRSTYYRNLNDIFSKTTAKSIFYKDWRSFVIPHFSVDELSMLGADVTKDREIIPVVFAEDSAGISALRKIFKNGQTVFSKEYFWDIILFESSLTNAQKKELKNTISENIRLTILETPTLLPQEKIEEQALRFSPYSATLLFKKEGEIQSLDPVVAYFEGLERPNDASHMIFRNHIKKE